MLAVAAISPAVGGPSLRILVKKEVSKQISRAQGPPGPPGIQGPPGNAATPPGGTLPAGATLRGAIYDEEQSDAGQSTSTAGGGVSFGYRLASRPTPHVIGPGAPSTTDCPGSPSAPAAASGHLCVYIAALSFDSAPTNGDKVDVLDPATSYYTPSGVSLNLFTGTTTALGDGKSRPSASGSASTTTATPQPN